MFKTAFLHHDLPVISRTGTGATDRGHFVELILFKGGEAQVLCRQFWIYATTILFREEEDKMKVRPLHDRVIVKRVEEEAKTKGGIIIPDTAKEKPVEGKVIAVGDGKVADDGKKIALEVKAGDKILFGKYAGTEIQIDGEEHLIMREDDIIAIIE
jgi:chaperonin GroES